MLRDLPLEPLVPLDPAQRNDVLSQDLRATLASLQRRFRFDRLKARKPEMPWTTDAVSDVATALKVAASRGVAHVWIDGIPGRRKKKWVQKPCYYAVRAKVAIQIEGQTRGLQKWEDRIVLVWARSPEDAERRLTKAWRDYGEPFLNGNGELVRWQLQEVVDVATIFEDELDPKGTEVWSSLYDRRMKPEYEWHPRKELALQGRKPAAMRGAAKKGGSRRAKA